MAIVISEVIVRVRAGEPHRPERERTDSQRREERARLVEDTVAEVMRILRRKAER